MHRCTVRSRSRALQGRVSAVAGPSGAGKSSLINALRLGRHRPDLQRPAASGAASSKDSGGEGGSSSGGEGAAGGGRDSFAEDVWALPLQLPPKELLSGSGLRGEGEGDALDSASHSPSPSAAAAAAGEVESEAGLGEVESEAGLGEPQPAPQADPQGESQPTGTPASSSSGPEFLRVGSVSRIGRGMHTTTRCAVDR
jgi:ribosome biogenesis GTPase